ncbi:MAG: peptidase M18 aminopeptidase I [Fusobacteria bacterium]|nr:MAG: peptidase M18 aminopeptidase I [Fusobacteriota bacterium]KAF0228680.1 MAG: peptidase M18 aminopeptidase [Fusobacteriota bacterium]
MEYVNKNIWSEIDNELIMDFAEGYKSFMSGGMTERAIVTLLEAKSIDKGYVDITSVDKLELGQGFYLNHRQKSFFMGVVNEELKSGLKLIGSHIDAPRLDLKQQPIYEEEGMALFKTHYYGGIKKYQWVTMPLCLEGVVYRKDGSKLELSIGRGANDPVFTITDLLPHLAQEQMAKTGGKIIEGEKLNVLIGSIPLVEGEKDPSVKKAILGFLNKEYGLIEEDFLRAELEILPNIPPRDIGFDRSMIGAYGQDDRICAYSLMKSFFEGEFSSSNVLACFFDKEEIGSNGDTGAQSRVLEYLMELLIGKSGMKATSLEVFFNSKGLSADVSAVDDPSYEGVFDKYNRGRLGLGPIISKYSGSKGKYDANDASAEYLSYVMGVLDKGKVMYQFGELGKVDLGGGGTIASYLSQLGMEVVDMGTGLLSMHSPFEVASKADLYMTYLGYRAFLEN